MFQEEPNVKKKERKKKSVLLHGDRQCCVEILNLIKLNSVCAYDFSNRKAQRVKT